jgi:hypothetical protein
VGDLLDFLSEFNFVDFVAGQQRQNGSDEEFPGKVSARHPVKRQNSKGLIFIRFNPMFFNNQRFSVQPSRMRPGCSVSSGIQTAAPAAVVESHRACIRSSGSSQPESTQR